MYMPEKANLLIYLFVTLFVTACAGAEPAIMTIPTAAPDPTASSAIVSEPLDVVENEPIIPDSSQNGAAFSEPSDSNNSSSVEAPDVVVEAYPSPESDTASINNELETEPPLVPSPDVKLLSLWYHGAENEEELAVLLQIVNEFNRSQRDYFVEIEDLPEETYNESIAAAALAGDLPDIIDVDGPVMPHWAWSGLLQPLDLPEGATDAFLPGTLGYWDDQLYSVGLWEAAVAIYARRSVLNQFDIRIPTLEDPWSLAEFDAALVTLQESGQYVYALDLGMAWAGEWYPYAFSPLMQSFGGDLIDRSNFTTAEGVINGMEAIAFAVWWQSLFERGLVPGTSQHSADRENGFLNGAYALQLNGNWAALPALERYGDDLLFLPAPDFGNGARIGAASWQFGVSTDSRYPEGANLFIEFALQDRYLAAFSEEVGLIPSTSGAAGLTQNYAPGGPLEVFFELSEAQGTLRPPTPAYLSAALLFETALADLANGADILDTLDAAAAAIDADLEGNDNYGFDGSVVGPSILEDDIARGGN